MQVIAGSKLALSVSRAGYFAAAADVYIQFRVGYNDTNISTAVEFV
jgi:hypothetical protein